MFKRNELMYFYDDTINGFKWKWEDIDEQIKREMEVDTAAFFIMASQKSNANQMITFDSSSNANDIITDIALSGIGALNSMSYSSTIGRFVKLIPGNFSLDKGNLYFGSGIVQTFNNLKEKKLIANQGEKIRIYKKNLLKMF